MEPKLILYLSSSMPGEWVAYEKTSGFMAVGKTRAEAHERFDALWSQRADYRIVDEAPAQANAPSFVNRASALAACHQRWSQRLRLNAKDGLVDRIRRLAVPAEMYELATK